MAFWINVLKFLDTEMTKPTLYGWFHIVSLILIVLCTVAVCVSHKRSKDPDKRVWLTVFITAIAVFILEIYKQINYSFYFKIDAETGDVVEFRCGYASDGIIPGGSTTVPDVATVIAGSEFFAQTEATFTIGELQEQFR